MSFKKVQRKIDASQAALVLLIQIHVRRLWVLFFVSLWLFSSLNSFMLKFLGDVVAYECIHE